MAPHQFFLKTWVSVFELSAAKVKARFDPDGFFCDSYCDSTGKKRPLTGDEWNAALDMDISVQVSRKCFGYL